VRAPLLLVTAALAGASAIAQETTDVRDLLRRVGERVETYYARAQSIICLETVSVQRMTSNLSAEGFPRRLEYDLRVSWDAATAGEDMPEPNTVRELRRVNGRAPKNSDEEIKCLDPRPLSLDPLAFLLPRHQEEYTFTVKGRDKIDRRNALRVEYTYAHPGEPEFTWRETCVSISLPARTTGRVWIDQATGDVLRVEEGQRGPYEIRMPTELWRKAGGGSDRLVFERSNVTIRYKTIAFRDPEETLILPESIDSLSVARESAVRITHTFSGYQRFVTDARIVQ